MNGSKSPAVVVTGASSGLGRATARTLDELGYRVFAGCRNPADAEVLGAEGLEPLLLDVSDPTAIGKSAEDVEARLGDGHLAGIVNNAGYGVVAPLEHVAIEDLVRQLQVNVVGAIAVAQAFLPLLRRGSGRIIVIGSPAVRLPLPMIGPYTLSKAALEAATDTLRVELAPSRIPVSLVIPGMIATPMLEKTLARGEESLAQLPPEGARRYEGMMRGVLRLFAEPAVAPSSPRKVARTIAAALATKRPRARYVVGMDSRVQLLLSRMLPVRILDGIVGISIRNR